MKRKAKQQKKKKKGKNPILEDGSPTPITDRHRKDIFPQSVPKAPPKVLRIPGK